MTPKDGFTRKLSRRDVLKGAAALGGLAAGASALAACAPTSQAPAATSSVAATATARAKVTLEVWGTTPDLTLGGRLLDAFTAKYPEVTFNRSVQANITTSAKVGLQSGSIDLLVHDPGWGTTNAWAAAGLLQPIDSYWTKYDWDKRITAYGKQGAIYKGKVYGITNEVSFIAPLFYKPAFDKYGLKAPTTYDEFVKGLDTLKKGGEIPIIAGLRAGAQSGHVFGPFAQAALGRAGLEKLLFGDGKWTDPRLVDAATRMRDLATAGYLDKDAGALDYNESFARFLGKKAAIGMYGVWALSQASEAFGEANFDFMTIPPWDSSIPLGYPGGLGSQWSIAASSKYADVAAEFLDFMYSDEGLKIWVEQNQTFPPVKADVTKYKLTPQQRKMTEIISKADTGAVGHWLGPYLPGTLNSTFAQGAAGVVSGQVSPQNWLSDVQKGWEAAIASGAIPR
jgi:raffinose/stachyose/melibiose transport system substrate-binding protein